MKTFVFALALAARPLSSMAALGASAENAYLAARDRDIAALSKIENAKNATARDAKNDKALKDLGRKLKSIIGPIAVAGFPKEGKLNLDSLFPHDQSFGMLDGIAYGDSESDKNLVVTTDGLLDKWLRAHRKKGPRDPEVPADAAAAVKTEIFYTWAVSTGAAAVHYTAIPVAAPPGAKFAYATLSARTQDASPDAPDQIFVALAKGGRVFIVNEKLATPMKPIAACDAVRADYLKKAEAAEKTYADSGAKNTKLFDKAEKLRTDGDAAFRACFGNRVKGTPAFKAATEQAAAIVAAFGG